MMIVLVHWFIDPARIDQFREWWSTHAPADVSGLSAEYLSEAVERSALPYKSDDLRSGSSDYVPFVNVGIWRDEQSFRNAINPQDGPSMDFEVQPRKRTVLLQRESHVGTWAPETQ
jgi:hypothetical protein